MQILKFFLTVYLLHVFSLGLQRKTYCTYLSFSEIPTDLNSRDISIEIKMLSQKGALSSDLTKNAKILNPFYAINP